MDQDYIRLHNERCRPEHQLMVHAIPEPFIGAPETAKVVLLNLNPGYDDAVEQHHRRPAIKEAIFSNLHRERREYPFSAFDPSFKGTGVANWSARLDLCK